MKTALVAALLLALSNLTAEEMRTWTSSDGANTVEAKLYKQDATNATLILQNGRSAQVPIAQLSEADQAYLKEAATRTDTEEGATGPEGKMAEALKGQLVDEDGKAAEIAGNPEYYLFYYSASWCGPCRAFTPDLITFNRRMDRHENMQVVLAPSDRSAEDAVAYLKDYRMPWPSIDYGAWRSGKVDVPRNPNGTIPSVVLADRNGKVLLANSKSLDRAAFLEQAKEIIEGK